MNKNIIFVLKTNQEYIRTNIEEAKDNEPLLNSLYESISNIYIPVLNMLENLENDKIESKLGLVFTPALINLLSNEEVNKGYVDWLEKRVLLGKSELKRCSKDKQLVENINNIIAKNESLKDDFINKYNKNLLGKYNEYYSKEKIELLATCGTDIFMPHYWDLPEVISAQIETGLLAFRSVFGQNPDGFWLPDLGYVKGIENIIRSYGFLYTILDSRSILLSNNLPENGIFYPVRTDNSLVLFASEPNCKDEIFGEEGYINNTCFRNENKDIGFDLELKQLVPFMKEGKFRYSTGYKYYNKCFCENQDGIYNQQEAKEIAEKYAAEFVNKKVELLTQAADCVKNLDFVNLVCTFQAEKLLKDWSEGIYFLEAVFRNIHNSQIQTENCNKLLDKQFTLEKVAPYYSSCEGEGYGENLLSSKNCWMMRYIRKANERMVDLAERFPTETGLKSRLLNIAAKELMIAQSSGLQKMIENEEFSEYAVKRFKQSISAFTTVFVSLGSNEVSTEWLTTLEIKDNIFPWMNYRIFSKKK